MSRRRCCLAFVLALLIVSLGLFSGCADSILMGGKTKDAKVEGMRVTYHQLRLRVRSLVNPMTGMVVDTADQIIAESDDPEVRRAALEWKIATVPAIRESLFEIYPQIALLDTWALSYQMMDYFETGPGARDFKSYAPMGYETALKINERMAKFFADVDDTNSPDGTELERAHQLIENWAHNHPVNGNFDSRENITNKATEMTLELGMSMSDAVDAMVTTVEDLSHKLDVYSDQIPNQMRWEAELFVEQSGQHYHVQETFDRMPGLMDASTKTLDQVSVTMDEMPGLISREREAALREFRETSDLALDRLSSERKAVMAHFTNERIAVMNGLDQARVAITNDWVAQVDKFEKAISTERQHFIADVEQVRVRLIQDGFRRILVILAIIAAYLTLMTVGVLWFLDRRVWKPRREAHQAAT